MSVGGVLVRPVCSQTKLVWNRQERISLSNSLFLSLFLSARHGASTQLLRLSSHAIPPTHSRMPLKIQIPFLMAAARRREPKDMVTPAEVQTLADQLRESQQMQWKEQLPNFGSKMMSPSNTGTGQLNSIAAPMQNAATHAPNAFEIMHHQQFLSRRAGKEASSKVSSESFWQPCISGCKRGKTNEKQCKGESKKRRQDRQPKPFIGLLCDGSSRHRNSLVPTPPHVDGKRILDFGAAGAITKGVRIVASDCSEIRSEEHVR